MSETENSITRSVHILRPRFEASDHLMENIQSLMNDDHRYRTNFEFYGTHQIAIDLYDYNNHSHATAIQDAEKAFVESQRVIKLGPLAKFVAVAPHKLRVMMKPTDQTDFNRLMLGLDTIPAMIQQPEMNHFLYTDLPRAAMLRTIEEREQAVSKLRLKSDASTLKPLRLSGFDYSYHVLPEEEGSTGAS